VSALVGEDLAALPYEARLPRLLAHGFGLWDVLGACEREGSLDSAIRNASSNDVALLRGRCPAWLPRPKSALPNWTMVRRTVSRWRRRSPNFAPR
jgi:G:T/U-mismatch repair DNA glycosylase